MNFISNFGVIWFKRKNFKFYSISKICLWICFFRSYTSYIF